MKAKLPNLELLEFKAKMYLLNTEEFNKRKNEKQDSFYKNNIILDAMVFPQMWGSTCGPFDIDKNGNPVMAGDAMTQMYTTVFHETTVDMYVVFFGDSVGYIIYDAKDGFYNDLKRNQLVSLGECLKSDRY